MRKAPSATPKATPTATARRRPKAGMVPPDMSWALSATAISAGSAMVVVKPIAAANK